MKGKLNEQKSTTVHIKDVQGNWTFQATLTYRPTTQETTQGVPPPPKPHFPPIPVRAVIGAVEDLLTVTSGEAILSKSSWEFSQK